MWLVLFRHVWNVRSHLLPFTDGKLKAHCLQKSRCWLCIIDMNTLEQRIACFWRHFCLLCVFLWIVNILTPILILLAKTSLSLVLQHLCITYLLFWIKSGDLYLGAKFYPWLSQLSESKCCPNIKMRIFSQTLILRNSGSSIFSNLNKRKSYGWVNAWTQRPPIFVHPPVEENPLRSGGPWHSSSHSLQIG